MTLTGILVKLVHKLESLPGEDPSPDFCCFSLSEECILKCRMCYKWQPDLSVQQTGTSPSPGQWKEAILSLRKIARKPLTINFGGGEPLLYQPLLELVRFASDSGFSTNVATNGFLIDANKAREIGLSGLTTINISLDSTKPEVHDHLRGVPGVYSRVIEAIRNLEEQAPMVKKGICAVISGVNLEGIADLAEAVQKDRRLEWIYFMAAMQPNNTAADKDWYKKDYAYLWPKDTTKALKAVDSLIRLKKKGYKIVNPVAQLRAFRSYFKAPDKFVKSAGCNLSRALHLSSTGDIFVCYNQAKLGNIKSDKIDGVWQSQQAGQVRKTVSICKTNCHFLVNCFFEGDFSPLFR